MDYTTIEELNAAIKTIEDYMGDTPAYTGYGSTLGEALSRYSNHPYEEVDENEIYTDFGTLDFYELETNTITIVYLTDNIEPNDDNDKVLLNRAMFTIRLNRAHTATPGSRVHLVNIDSDGEIIKSEYYNIKIYDTNALRATVQGDYEQGFLYWFYFNGTDVVLNGMNQSATAQIVADINIWKLDTGNRFSFTPDDDGVEQGSQVGYIILSSNAGEPQSSMYAKELKFNSKLLSNFIAGSNSFLYDENGLAIEGAVDFSQAVVIGQTATEDEHMLTWGQFKTELEAAVTEAINSLIIADVTTPELSTNVPADVADGVIYFQLAEEE